MTLNQSNISTLIKSFLILFLVFGMGLENAQAQKKKKKKKEKQATEERGQDKEINADHYFIEGLRYSLKEEDEKAVKNFEKALTLMPENAAIHFKLAESYSKLNYIDKAFDHAQLAVEYDPKNEYYYKLLARLYEYKSDFEGAIQTYKDLLANVPNSESNYYELALLQILKGQWEDALNSYDRFEEAFGINPEISTQKQKIYLKLNQLDNAIAEGDKLIKAYPENPEYSINQAILLNSNDKKVEAQQLLDSLLTKRPNLSGARLVLFEIYRDQKKDDEAYAELKKAFEDPNLEIGQKAGILAGYSRFAETDIQKGRAKELGEILVKVHPNNDVALSMVGDIYLGNEEKEKALEYYKASVKINPSDFNVWMNILILNFEEENYDTLVFYSEQMVQIYPNNSRVWFLQGLGYYSLESYEKAKYSLESARKWGANQNSLLVDIEATLGDTYYNLGEYEDSDDSYEYVLAQDPENDHVLNNYSYFLSLRNEKLDKALKMSETLVKKYPDNSTYLDTHAWVLFQREEYEKALPFLERATKTSDSGVVHEHLGDVLFKMGREDEAIEAWKKAKELGGAGEFLEKKLENGKWYE